jgi:simple sugar transport system substrate-binding protein
MRKLVFLLTALLLVVSMLAACAAPPVTAPAADTGAESAPTEAAAAMAEEGAGEEAAAATTQWAGAGKPADQLKFGTVVKSSAFNWFIRMDEGVKQFAADTGIDAFQQGPSEADAAMQIQVTEDVLAQNVDALLLVPYQVPPMEPVMQKARERGVVVVTHEASDVQNADYDVEAFDNAGYGRHLMDNLANCMGEEGKYAVFVGSLTSTSHNEWVDAAVAYQQEAYPNMEMVGTKNETGDDVAKAYQITKELLKTYPDLKGFQGSAATDVVGVGQAVEEAGLQDETCVVGTSITSYASEGLSTGAIDIASAWDPAMAGYAMNAVAQKLLNGEEITDGMDLGVPGYEEITLIDKVIYGSAWIDITEENKLDYNF